MYAYFKKLDYFSTVCIYAPFAARGLARDFVKDLEVRGQFVGARFWPIMHTMHAEGYAMPGFSHAAVAALDLTCASDNCRICRVHPLAFLAAE